MLKPRVIPVLLIQNKGLVKTVKFRNPTYIGDPINAIKIFNEKEVDELVVLDIEASQKNKGIDWKQLNRINREAFMPMAYGGGVKTIDDVKRIINLGYEKIILNTIALENQDFISEASAIVGSQSIVVCIDITKSVSGNYQIYNHKSYKTIATDPAEYIYKVIEKGAGEIMIQSMDRDGTYTDYEIDFLKRLVPTINIPVIALGGASAFKDIVEVLKTGVSAAAAGSIFVYFGKLKAVLINYTPDFNNE